MDFKKYIFLFLLLWSFNALSSREMTSVAKDTSIRWMSWKEAIEANKSVPKKIMIDLFTEWCGWCKRMDATTFVDPSIVDYVNKNFYAVKFDAEQKDSIIYNDHTFHFLPDGRRGVHELAYALLDGKLGYPTLVYLTPTMERIMISPGFKQVDMLIKEMKFAYDDSYLTTTWEEYQKK
ncbi:MAG: DUF255 domain-containing protein [Saprospiraceae bacterium]